MRNMDDYSKLLLGLEDSMEQSDISQNLIGRLRYNTSYTAFYLAKQDASYAETLKLRANGFRDAPFADTELALAVAYLARNPNAKEAGPQRRRAQQAASDDNHVLQALYDEGVRPQDVQKALGRGGGIDGLLRRRRTASQSEDQEVEAADTGDFGDAEVEPEDEEGADTADADDSEAEDAQVAGPATISGEQLLEDNLIAGWTRSAADAFEDLREGYGVTYIHKWARVQGGRATVVALGFRGVQEERVPLELRLEPEEKELS